MSNGLDLAVKLSEGNPGAISVLRDLQWYTHWHLFLKYFEKANIKGPDIWILYKDEYKQDFSKLAAYLETKI